jgi:cyanophycinase
MTAERKSRARTRGGMILIGGSEDKAGDRGILRQVVARAGKGPFIVATLASEEPERQWEVYARIFRELGLRRLVHLDIRGREDALDPVQLEKVAGASGIFFTGGDQVRITTKLKGTELYARVRELFEGGTLVAGTSAGASAMGTAMLVGGSTKEESHKVGGAFYMAQGLGFVDDLIIDQHFAQRARIERLIGAVAENPGGIALGIDEDTAVVLDDQDFSVIGAGAVYVADGRTVTHTNMSEAATGKTLCLFDATLHVLCRGSGFNLRTRRPIPPGD